MAERPAHAKTVRAVLIEGPLWLVWRLASWLETAWHGVAGGGLAPGARPRHRRRPGHGAPAENPGEPQEPDPDRAPPAAG